MAGVSSKSQKQHHNLAAAVLSREEKTIEKLLATINGFTDPFLKPGTELFNLVTKVVMPENIKEDMCYQIESGRKLLHTFVEERIKSEKVNLWSPLKRRKLQTWKSTEKVVKVSTKVVQLQEDRFLFARMMMVSKSRPEILIKRLLATISSPWFQDYYLPQTGQCFTVQPKVLYQLYSRSLMVEDTVRTTINNEQPDATTAQKKVIILDGMAELQFLDKPDWIKDCSQLANYFCNRIVQKHVNSDEVRLVFDRYDLPSFLKAATREIRQGGQDPDYYRIPDSTLIAKVPMKRLLSHIRIKMDLTVYLAEKITRHAVRHGKRFVVARGFDCRATHKDVTHLQRLVIQEKQCTRLSCSCKLVKLM